MINLNRKLILTIPPLLILSVLIIVTINFKLPFYILSFFLALCIPGFIIGSLFDYHSDTLTKIITAPVFTIFFFIPSYFVFTKITDEKVGLLIAIFFLCTLTLLFFLKKKNYTSSTETLEKRPFLITITAFLILHLISISLYKFIPEVDGYTYLLNLESKALSDLIDTGFRPFFYSLIYYLSSISHIAPYQLFKFWMILLQISGIYYLYQIILKTNIQTNAVKYVALLSFLSIPIINLEIEYIRPNIIFIFAILPFVYYLSEGLENSKRKTCFLISTVISSVGLLFHDFFVFLFLINTVFITIYFYKKLNPVQRMFGILTLVICLFIFLININKLPILPLLLYGAEQMLKLISSGISWKWWFLENYSNMDGNNLGWNGPSNILKYYAYSLSPVLFITLFTYPVILWNKLRKKIVVTFVEKIALSIACVGLFFAEILPRINYPTLPDRFWPMISISFLILLPFTLSEVKSPKKSKALSIFLCALIAIGIGGTLYISYAKGGYTTEREYNASQWIKKNTPADAGFITQIGNMPMVSYFAKREIIVPPESFFLPLENSLPLSGKQKSQELYLTSLTLFKESLNHPNDSNLLLLKSSIEDYHREVKFEKLLHIQNNPMEKIPKKDSLYVLYSKDKFTGYYATRDWWRKINFNEADLQKFHEKYPLVYNDDDEIYIWKIK